MQDETQWIYLYGEYTLVDVAKTLQQAWQHYT